MRPVDRQEGFTLLETLVALAILSVVSLALMQSTVSTLRSNERAIMISEKIVDQSIYRQSYRQAIQGFVVPWGEEDQVRFTGGREQFDLNSAMIPNRANAGLSRGQLRLEADTEGRVVLHWSDGEIGTNLAQFNGRSARFSYLGKDRQWYEVWPPEDVPTSGNPVDDRLSDVPQWPLAIGLWVEEDGGDRTFWVESVTRTPTRTFDSDDI